MRLTLALVAAVFLAAAAEARPSEPRLPVREAGLLTCTVDPSFGVIFGTTLRLDCVFDARGLGREHYVGHMDRSGERANVPAGKVLSWKVWTPGGEVRERMLVGAFVGPSAAAAAAIGTEALELLGDRGECIALAPAELSAEGKLNPAFRATALDLRSAHRATP